MAPLSLPGPPASTEAASIHRGARNPYHLRPFGDFAPDEGLKRLGADPAVASSVFVLTLTDVMAFFSFLGLATVVLL
jgi:hypothetical protein